MRNAIFLLLPLAIACGNSTSSATSPDSGMPGHDGPLPDHDGPPADAPAPAVPEMLATGEPDPNSIAVYQGAVYWTTDPVTSSGEVKKLVPGESVQILSAQEDAPTAIAVGPGFLEPTVFWCTDSLLGQIRQIAATGAPPLSAVSVGDVCYSLVLDGDAVFAGTRSAVKTKDLTNTSTPTTLAGGYGNGVLAITADASDVLFGTRTVAGSWIIAEVSRGGGTVTTLYTGTRPIRAIAVVGAYVYWLEGPEIMRVARSGGSPDHLVGFTSTEPWAMASADDKLFIATNSGVINPSGAVGMIVELDPATIELHDLAYDQPEPYDLAVDGSYVYWANHGIGSNTGQIMRIAR